MKNQLPITESPRTAIGAAKFGDCSSSVCHCRRPRQVRILANTLQQQPSPCFPNLCHKSFQPETQFIVICRLGWWVVCCLELGKLFLGPSLISRPPEIHVQTPPIVMNTNHSTIIVCRITITISIQRKMRRKLGGFCVDPKGLGDAIGIDDALVLFKHFSHGCQSLQEAQSIEICPVVAGWNVRLDLRLCHFVRAVHAAWNGEARGLSRCQWF